MSALATPDLAGETAIERNWFIGAVLKALGSKADLYR